MEFSHLNINDVLEYIIFFPKSHDFSKLYQFNIRQQNGFPNCSACSALTCIEYLRQIDGYPFERLSILYQYYMSRLVQKNEGELKGVYSENSFKSLVLNGALEPTKKPINMQTINIKPTDEEIKKARERIVLDNVSIYRLESNINVFKYVLTVVGVPFVIAFSSPKKKLRARDKSIITSEEGDVNDGNHAVCVVGFDDEEQVLIFQNSYGTKWKYDGFGKLHYSCIPNIYKAIALNRSCIKDDVNFEMTDDNYLFIMETIIDNFDNELTKL